MSHTIFGTAHLGIARCICPTNPDGCPLHPTGTILTGDGLSQANDQLESVAYVQVSEPGSSVPLPVTAEEHARVTKQRDDAIAERDNMVDLTIQVGRLGDYLKHAIADRDEYRENADVWRDKFESAQCRMDEMADEIKELRGAK